MIAIKIISRSISLLQLCRKGESALRYDISLMMNL